MLDNGNYNKDLECSVTITVIMIMIVTLSVIMLKVAMKVKMVVPSEITDGMNMCKNRDFIKFNYTVL
jgi:hypothetical protein